MLIPFCASTSSHVSPAATIKNVVQLAAVPGKTTPVTLLVGSVIVAVMVVVFVDDAGEESVMEAEVGGAAGGLAEGMVVLAALGLEMIMILGRLLV